MSWSVNAVGKPVAVKASLAKQFASAKDATKYIPEEQASVVGIESAVNAQLDLMASAAVQNAVSVTANGSASVRKDGEAQPPTTVQASCTLEFKTLYGFVE